MRASRRFEGHIWLDRRMDEPSSQDSYPLAKPAGSLVNIIHALNAEFDLVTVFERMDDSYSLRCYPRKLPALWLKPNWAASYAGYGITDLAAKALEDYGAVVCKGVGGLFSRTEVVRCVAS